MKDSPWRRPYLARLTFGEIHNLVDEYIFGQSLRILDVGCGRGWLSLELAREGHDVIGIDSSKEMIQNAKRTMDTDPYKAERGNLDFQVSDFSQWNHPAESFDLVIFSRSLHHILQPSKAVRRAHDLLKKDGQLICIEYAYDRLDKKTATWIYNVRRSLQQSGWYKSRKKISDKIDQSANEIIEEYNAPTRKEHYNRFEEMRKPLNKLFREAHFSWEPYIYWDLIMDMRVPSEDVEMATARSIMATELSKLTGFKLHHNHVSIDFVRSIFQFGTPPYNRLVDKYRREMLEEAAKEQVDTIFSFVYGKGEDDEFVKDVIRRVESHNGKVLFVKLYGSRRELSRRVAVKSRKKRGKLASKRDLDRLFKDFDLVSDVPFAKSLSIETTHDSPRKVARSIADHYELVKPRNRANEQK